LIDLHDKRAFVTGGGRGIGRATVLLLARAGARVAVGFRRRREAAEAVVGAVGDAGGHAVAVGGDLGEAAAARRAVQEVVAALGGLDVLVLNHGVWPPEGVPLAGMSDAQWAGTRRANLDAAFLVCRAAIPHLSEGSAIVLVSSAAGRRGEAGHADYAATKGALIALTKSLALELAPRVRVNCVAPGWVDTEMSAPALASGRTAVEREIPLRRIAQAEDVAGPIVFLCSALARHMTGEVVHIDGGSASCG
jgi:3-oxoacyl-[acyl-carrier protein] reductase